MTSYSKPLAGRFLRNALAWLSALIALTANCVQAVTLQELYQQDRLIVKTWLDKDQVAAKEQVVLNIEVATDTWFLGGSRIGGFEVENALVLRRQKLATNFTERRKGQTWSVQHFEITLYPQSSGDYVVPPIALDLTVAGASREKISGTILTPALRFSASLPSPLITEDTPWLVASDYQLDVSYSTEPGEPLTVGDALELTIRQDADNTTGMLLPQFTLMESPLAKAYPAPSDLQDEQNRGHYRAIRTDKVTYMIRDGGEIVFSATEVLWWNPESQQLETLTLPEARWQVQHTPLSWLKAHWQWFAWAAALVIALWLAKGLLGRLPRPEVYDFAKALWRNDRAEARRLLYRRYRRNRQQLVLPAGEQPDDWRRGEFGLDEASASISQYWRLWWSAGSATGKGWSLPPALPALKRGRNASN